MDSKNEPPKTGSGGQNDSPQNEGSRPSFPKATGLLVIVFCAVLGYIFASRLISCNLVQYRTPVKTFMIDVKDEGSASGRKVFCLPVYSRLKIDSAALVKPEPGTGYNNEDILFHENPVFMVWMILICTMISIASGSAVFFIAKIKELYKRFELPGSRFGWSCAFACSIVLLLLYGNRNIPGYFQPPQVIDTFHILLKNGNVIVWFVFITMLLALPGLILLFLIGSSSDRIHLRAKAGIAAPTVSNQKIIEESVMNLKYLNHLLQNTLQILAIIVVFAVLTTKTLGDSIKAAIYIKGFDLYPSQVSYIYGMYFTLFLCIIYIPVYAYLKNNYNNLNDVAAQQSGGATSPWYNSLFGQNRFEGTALSNIKLALTVVAPLLTSLLPDAGGLIK